MQQWKAENSPDRNGGGIDSRVSYQHVGMTPHAVHAPLDRFPAFRTTDPDRFEAAALTCYGATRVDLSKFDGALSRGNIVRLTDITLGFSSCGEATIWFPEADYARQQFALDGCGQIAIGGAATQLDRDQSCLTSPGEAARIDYRRGFTQLILRVARAPLHRKLAALLGAAPQGELVFSPATAMTTPAARSLLQLITFLTGELDACADGPLPLALHELEQAVIVAFLSANRHSFSLMLERSGKDAAPHQVRRAEEFIQANWHQAITIEQLANVTGVSARSLFKAFQQHRGYSPHQFAKRTRLERARAILYAPDSTTSVTAAAFACGFANLGHFARDYRKAFGELPSAALASRPRLQEPSRAAEN